MIKEKEIWIDIIGWDGYRISSWGNVFSTKTSQIPTPYINSKGYLRVQLSKGKGRNYNLRVNRLVAVHFIPNPENKPEVGHNDCNKLNNYYKNLNWETRKENVEHAKRNKLFKSGVDHPFSKLSNQQAVEIKNSSLSIRKLAKIYDVGKTSVERIKNGSSYKEAV